MEVPIFENEAPVGMLRIYSQGLYTVFQARLPAGRDVGADSIRPPMMAGADPSGRQIAAPAGKREGSSGAANPALSPTRLWLIGKCGTAAPLGLLRQEKDGRSLCRKLSRMECGRLPRNPVRALVLPNGEKPGEAAKNSVNESSRTPPPAQKANDPDFPSPTSESSWRPLPDGSLIDQERCLLALPWGGGALPAPTRKIMWNGQEYWLFRY